MKEITRRNPVTNFGPGALRSDKRSTALHQKKVAQAACCLKGEASLCHTLIRGFIEFEYFRLYFIFFLKFVWLKIMGWVPPVGEIQLLCCVTLFGLTFVLQRMAATNDTPEYEIKPLTYNAARHLVSTICLVLVTPYLKQHQNPNEEESKEKSSNSVDNTHSDDHSPTYYTWYYGTWCGIATFCGSTCQQIGLIYVSIAKVAFITSLYVMLVPITESLLACSRLSAATWCAALMSLIGTFFLSGMADLSEEGDENHMVLLYEGLVFIGTLFWTLSIMVVDRGCKKVDDVVALTGVDFFICTLFAFMAALIYELDEFSYPFTHIRNNMSVIVLSGIGEAASFTFCSLGQTSVSSSRSAVILSLESLSGAICGYLILNESLTDNEVLGCCLMSISFLISRNESWEFADIYHWSSYNHNHSGQEYEPIVCDDELPSSMAVLISPSVEEIPEELQQKLDDKAHASYQHSMEHLSVKTPRYNGNSDADTSFSDKHIRKKNTLNLTVDTAMVQASYNPYVPSTHEVLPQVENPRPATTNSTVTGKWTLLRTSTANALATPMVAASRTLKKLFGTSSTLPTEAPPEDVDETTSLTRKNTSSNKTIELNNRNNHENAKSQFADVAITSQYYNVDDYQNSVV